MYHPANASAGESSIYARGEELFREHQQRLFVQTDRMFAILLVFQWVAGILAALWISPRAWIGGASEVHPHVWAAVVLAGLIDVVPIALAIFQPGKTITRHAIAIAQMSTSAILIHLSGGRIETHFHVFGSLAFLSVYRDWRVLITASAMVAVDHFARSMFWPQSVFGVLTPTWWRWLEHTGWVVFEDVILIYSCIRGTTELRKIALNTAQLEASAQMRYAKEAAEAGSRAKSAFLANMSHEIRTPMTAIMGYAETLLEPDQTVSDRHDALQVIRRSARHLLELINDILDISKIEADKMTVERIPMDLPQITADVVSLMRPSAIAKGLGFQLTFGEMIPRTIHSDPLRVKQILMNLVGNALKFTDRGEIRLKVSSEIKDGECTILLEVTDTGIGMTREQIQRLFQPFSQADDTTTRRFGGTGLGLTISKRLAELLGGKLTVESLVGVGSMFRVSLDGGPVAGVEMLHGFTEAVLTFPSMERTNKRIRLCGRILLAEDGPDNQQLISFHLRKAGAEVVIAENGRIALNLERAQSFDLILMDMQMPEVDGYSATSQLRSRGCELPIIALTAHAMPEDRTKCLAAGCTDYLTKPIEKNTLLTALAAYLPGSTLSDVVPEGSPTLPESSHREDSLKSSFANDPDMVEAIQEFVATLPHRVSTVNRLLSEGNLTELHRAVHQLKGAGGGYGFDQITRLAAIADTALKDGEPLEKIEADINSLLAVARSVEGYQPSQELIHD